LKCASCTKKDCFNGKDCLENREEIKELYREGESDLLKASSAIEARYYMEKTRIEEVILFSKEMNYKKIGMAFCVGLEQEAHQIQKIFKNILKSTQFAVRYVVLIRQISNWNRLIKKVMNPCATP